MADEIMNFKFTSLNGNGLGDDEKRAAVIGRLKSQGNDIFAIVDTRFSKQVQEEIRKKDKYRCIFAGESSESKGIALFRNPRSEIDCTNQECDKNGQFCIAEVVVEKNPLLLSYYTVLRMWTTRGGGGR